MNKMLMPGLIGAFVLGLIFFTTGVLFVMVALLPSVIAYFTDERPARPVFKTVLASNAAAALPSLLPMMKEGMDQKHTEIFNVMSDPKTWLFIYAGAAAGWGLIFFCRTIGRFALSIHYRHRITVLERMQKKLVAEWGERILGK